jgi:hypothetical protein
MLVRLGVGGANSVPEGQRIVRATRPFERAVRALPYAGRGAGPGRQEHVHAPEEPVCYVVDARRAQQADDAYRAAQLIQPRPGLIIRVQA